MSKGVYILMGGLAVLMVGAIVTTDHPKRAEPTATYQDLADVRTERCVMEKGYGRWVGSSGVTLQQFCRAEGQLEATQQARKDHPEAF
jgi:hypothetical protein